MEWSDVLWPPLPTRNCITEGIPIPSYAGDPIVTAKIGGLEPLLDKDPSEWVLQQQGELQYTSGQLLVSGVIWFVLKTVGVIFFILLPRGVFPRIRVDMLLNLGWHKLIGLCIR